MHKTKYYYNPITCSYERIQTSILSLVLRGFTYTIFSLVLALVMARYYKGRFLSPREVELLETNTKLKSYYHVVQQKIDSSAALLASLQERDNALYRLLLNTTPLSMAEKNAGMGGVHKYAHLGNETIITQTLSKVDQLMSRLTIQKKSYDQILKLAQNKASILRSTPTLLPVSKEYLRVSAHFGMRLHPIYKIYRKHEGIDFAAPIHTPIYAAADGYVQWIKIDKKGFGNHLLIEHGNGFQTHYAHMYAITIKERQRVTRGQQIGTVGNSGDSTAPHLHYEVYFHGHRVNPLHYFVGKLTAAEYAEVKKQSTHQTQTFCSNY